MLHSPLFYVWLVWVALIVTVAIVRGVTVTRTNVRREAERHEREAERRTRDVERRERDAQRDAERRERDAMRAARPARTPAAAVAPVAAAPVAVAAVPVPVSEVPAPVVVAPVFCPPPPSRAAWIAAGRLIPLGSDALQFVIADPG